MGCGRQQCLVVRVERDELELLYPHICITAMFVKGM